MPLELERRSDSCDYKKGRKKWKERISCHLRSLSETGMYRMKTVVGGNLKNQKFENQQTEVRLRYKLLNK